MEKNYRRVTLIYMTSLILVAVIFLLGYLEIIKSDILSSLLLQLVIMLAIPLLLYTILVSKNFKKTLSDVGFKKINGKMLLLAIAIGVVVYLINTFAANFFAEVLSLVGFESLGSPKPVELDYAKILKEFILSALLPGFCEEVLHRGILLHAGKKYRNTRFCLIISSILFGLTHLNINQFFYASVVGLLIGHTMLTSGSIYPAMIIHFMNNALNNYFYYGTYLNWPYARLINVILNYLLANLTTFFAVVMGSLCLLIFLYIILNKAMFNARKKYEVNKIVDKMRKGVVSIDTAIARIDLINQVFNMPRTKQNKAKSSFATNVFLICSIIIAGLITISTFIWGIL